MANNGLDDLIKKLDRIENHLSEEIAPEVNELLKESVRFSLIDWYNDYDPQDYQRTYNFMNILNNTRTIGKGNLITMYVDSGSMSNYPGWNGYGYGNSYTIGKSEKYSNQKLNASIAFDFMFMNGEHGHGKWMMHQSLSPYMYVDADIRDGFGGRINKVINNKIEKILKG